MPVTFKFFLPQGCTIRKVIFPSKPKWHEIATRIESLSGVSRLAASEVAVSYINSNNHSIAISTDEELQGFYEQEAKALDSGRPFKFFVERLPRPGPGGRNRLNDTVPQIDDGSSRREAGPTVVETPRSFVAVEYMEPSVAGGRIQAASDLGAPSIGSLRIALADEIQQRKSIPGAESLESWETVDPEPEGDELISSNKFLRTTSDPQLVRPQQTEWAYEGRQHAYIPRMESSEVTSNAHALGSAADADIGHLITWISPTPVKVNGGFGDVFAGTHSRVGKVALKRPRIGLTGYNEDLMRRFRREAVTWEKLQHPHILRCLGTFQRDGHFYFVSPFIENGTLFEYIVLHPSINRIKLLCEAADAISYLHAQGVVHGDIKASNLLAGGNGQVLLCDFGLTKTIDLSTTTAMKGVGSLRWQSPELWDGDSKSFKSDVYAFGITIAEVLTGEVPFPDLQTEGAVIRAVLIQGRRPTKIPAVSSSGLSYTRVWAIAEACWSTIPEERIPMNDALRFIQEDLQLAVVQEI